MGWIALAAASVMMAPACLKAKDRAWQTGTVLDTYKNIYFGDAEYKPVKDAGGSAVQDEYGTYAVAMNDSSSGKVFRQNYVIDSPASAFLVSITQLKAFKEPHLSFVKPVKFAVEKNKLWFVDLDGQQYEAKILKRLDKNKPVIAQRRQPVAVAKPVALAKPVTVAKAESVKPPTRPQVRISETDRAWQAGQLL
ncbi:MAG TPA: hypothetical protein VFW83_11500, partial [Bryobacteraceae bacterium]|nr:hypothetical protein [Bryobacteraceae bacterium]